MQTITEDGEVINSVEPQPLALVEGPFFKTPWNHDRDAESLASALICLDPSRTQQQFAKEADINNILAKFLTTGELNQTGGPKYQDVEELLDLQDSIVTRHEVDLAWSELPAAVRNILKDPKTFTEYVTHCVQTGDLEPLRELGLAKGEAMAPENAPEWQPPQGAAKEEPVKAPKAPSTEG